jgi:hypothetical protein
MWTLWRTAQETHSRPSDLVCVEDRLAAFLFDNAVITFGRTFENALEERVNLGSSAHPRWESKYELSDMLSDSFHLPTQPHKLRRTGNVGSFSSGVSTIMMLAAQHTHGIRRWEYQGKEN